MGILGPCSLLQCLDGYMQLGPYNIHIQNAIYTFKMHYTHSKCTYKGYSWFSGTQPSSWLLIQLSPPSKETSASSITSLCYLLIHFGTSSHGFLFPSSTQKGLGSSSKIQARHLEGAFENPRMVLKGTLQQLHSRTKHVSTCSSTCHSWE